MDSEIREEALRILANLIHRFMESSTYGATDDDFQLVDDAERLRRRIQDNG